MKQSEIITLSPVTVKAAQFKDKRLQEATRKITAIYQDAAKYADTKNREIARILSEVAEGKAYEKDGFKSIADYAAQTFGIARQNAYSLATAGKIYNDEKAPESLKQFSPSKLAEVAALPRKRVEKDIAEGKISADTTQKDLREYKNNVQAEKEKKDGESAPEIVKQYSVRLCTTAVPAPIAAAIGTPRTMEDWDKFFVDQIAGLTSSEPETVETVKLPKGKVTPDSKKSTVTRTLYFNRSTSLVVEYLSYSGTPLRNTADGPEYTEEQLVEMLARIRAAGKKAAEGK